MKIGEEIGKGRYGCVFKGEMTDGSVIALKWQKSISDHERDILNKVKGKKFQHIIQVLAFEENQDGVFIIMELE